MGRRILCRRLAAAIIAVQAANMSMISVIARANWLTAALYLVALTPVVFGLILLNVERVRRRTVPQGAPAS